MRLQKIKYSIPSVRYSTSSKIVAEKKDNKKPQIQTPAIFDKRLDFFKKGLKAELKAIYNLVSLANIKKNLNKKNQVFCNLKAKKISYDTIYGQLIELCDSKLVALNTKFFPKAKPFILKQNNKEFFSHLLHYDPKNGTILLKLNSTIDEWKELRENSTFDLLPSHKSPLENVLEFLHSGRFTKMPGWKTLELIYKGSRSPVAYSDPPVKFNGEFNTAQQNAIKAALNPKRKMLCIGGPPGTGKTQVIVEILRYLLEDRKKILVVVPRPDVLTNIYERIDLMKYKSCAMVGDESAHIDMQTKNHRDFEYLEDMTDIICEIKGEDVDSSSIRDYIGLVDGAKKKINLSIVNNSQIVFTSAGRNVMGLIELSKFTPDVVLVEEGSQVLECVSWRFLLSGKRSIVVGDHNQLVTTLNSESAAKDYQLDNSIMEYLWNNFSKVDRIMLDTQYRMNKKIMEWSSKIFYDNAMIAHDSVENITLSDISSIKNNNKFNSPLLVFDSKNCSDFKETIIGRSFANIKEVFVCVKYVRYLLQNGLKESDIGIITSYNKQRMKIEEHLKGKNIKVSTVDGFQGQQKEVIVFCYVRDNKNKNVGFLSEEKRMNVALTRAKRQFVFIGNTNMLSTDDKFEELRNILLNNGVSLDAVLQNHVNLITIMDDASPFHPTPRERIPLPQRQNHTSNLSSPPPHLIFIFTKAPTYFFLKHAIIPIPVNVKIKVKKI
uniref:DNA-binding protein SMUBP-2 (inferred by orthology to a human protein) n=1 Tax=Strongyloides venezuelensis TaxID=75913 RepID=A0A0K0FEV7_STRVS